jgi:hypothetical protein
MPIPGLLTPEHHAKIDAGIRAMQTVLPLLDAAEACGCNVTDRRELQKSLMDVLQSFKKQFPLTPDQVIGRE